MSRRPSHTSGYRQRTRAPHTASTLVVRVCLHTFAVNRTGGALWVGVSLVTGGSDNPEARLIRHRDEPGPIYQAPSHVKSLRGLAA